MTHNNKHIVARILILASTISCANVAHAHLFSKPIAKPEPNTPVTPQIKAEAEAKIQVCEKKYLNAKELQSRLINPKKPGVLSSSTTKQAYEKLFQEKDLYLKAYQQSLNQLASFTSGKINIRIAKTSKEMDSEATAYASKCERMAEQVAGFIEWATTGKAKPGFESIYKLWLDGARNSK